MELKFTRRHGARLRSLASVDRCRGSGLHRSIDNLRKLFVEHLERARWQLAFKHSVNQKPSLLVPPRLVQRHLPVREVGNALLVLHKQISHVSI